MTETAKVTHTPGPWHADPTEESSEVLTADGVCIAQAIEPTDRQYVPLLPRGEVQANRSLIAAAPDYHKAAKERIARHDAQVQAKGGTECQDEFCNTFRPIVAKAEGCEP